jgi:hypothetical protein
MSASASRQNSIRPAAARPQRSVPDPQARAAQGIRLGRAGVDVAEFGRALADQTGEIRDRASAGRPFGPEGGGGVPLPQRGLVALERDRADAGAMAGPAVHVESGVSPANEATLLSSDISPLRERHVKV